MTPEIRQAYPENLSKMIADACVELFASFPYPLIFDGAELGNSERSKFSHAGVISFFGNDLNGALSVSCTREVLKATHPLSRYDKEKEPTRDHLNDWICEVANQLLGRVKNGVLRYGASFDLGTPTIVKGKDVSVTSTDDAPLLVLWFKNEACCVAISFSTIIRPGIDFLTVSDDVGPILKEGGNILF